MDTSVNYLGLQLRTPIIVGSCGLSSSISDMQRMEEAGAGAIVLKTRFEEEFAYDIKRNTPIYMRTSLYGENYKYVADKLGDFHLDDYFEYLRKVKSSLSIPVIGSINCISFESWVNYMKRYDDAGIDALEINIALRPYDSNTTVSDVERVYNQLLATFRRITSIPLAVKLGYYFTDLAKFVQRLSWSGVKGVVLFDRDAPVDIDIDDFSIRPLGYENQSKDLAMLMRWVGSLSNKTKCGISAASSIEDWHDVVKALLVGAASVQVTSCLYHNGIEYIGELQKGLESWMEKHGFDSVGDFHGKLALGQHDDVASILRIQSLKSTFEM
ncbi:MAG: hypothetical protein II793_05435 [Bacteroidales bacterium]|nr:hypothetical protein [Bacteroidales bacterium]